METDRALCDGQIVPSGVEGRNVFDKSAVKTRPPSDEESLKVKTNSVATADQCKPNKEPKGANRKTTNGMIEGKGRERETAKVMK